VENIRACAGQFYSEYYLVGQSVVNYDLKSVITADNMPVTIALVVAIGVILLLMFRSFSLPVILLLAIESATWINLGIPYFMGSSMNYIGYQIISAVQLGATVDYGILFTHHYLTSRNSLNKKESVIQAVTKSSPTVLTPALILIIAAIMLGLFSSNGIISQLGSILGRGTAISTAMVLMVLPALLMLLDPVIQKTTLRASFKKGDAQKCKAKPGDSLPL
jgi:predicted RND superfamily exporter protein